MKLTPLHDSFIFQFKDEITSSYGTFVEKTDFGFVYGSKAGLDTAKQPRWAIVKAIGPDVKEFGVGDSVLIAPLRWTEGIEFDGERLWRSVEGEVLAVEEKE